ncbi:hypothetical protein AVEN_95614-1 [Araneus ventricosus]|uniref:Uncharacterized protein n=1 Tax=Araneus ventricosus TaxID=182803 RepID=A0A4Y2IJ92_ARAVE|nr:hypothetical protein AVEN_95614-1 [Araneus ventricosus]
MELLVGKIAHRRGSSQHGNLLTSRTAARNQSKNQRSLRPERPAFLMPTPSPFSSTSCGTAFSRVPFQPSLTAGISSPGERLS